MAKKKDPRKITEKKFMTGETRYNFYPKDHGGEDGAFKACALAAIRKDVFWNKVNACWYYYLSTGGV